MNGIYNYIGFSNESALVFCSCGKDCIVVFATALGKYIAQKSGWVFDNGWSRGKPGHTQDGFEMPATRPQTQERATG